MSLFKHFTQVKSPAAAQIQEAALLDILRTSAQDGEEKKKFVTKTVADTGIKDGRRFVGTRDIPIAGYAISRFSDGKTFTLSVFSEEYDGRYESSITAHRSKASDGLLTITSLTLNNAAQPLDNQKEIKRVIDAIGVQLATMRSGEKPKIRNENASPATRAAFFARLSR